MSGLRLTMSDIAEAQDVDRKLLPEPTAFCLATIDTDGRPAAHAHQQVDFVLGRSGPGFLRDLDRDEWGAVVAWTMTLEEA